MSCETNDTDVSAVSIHYGDNINNFSFHNDPIEIISYGIDYLLEDVCLERDVLRDKPHERFDRYYSLENKKRETYPVREHINCDSHQDEKDTIIKIEIANYVIPYIKDKIQHRRKENNLYIVDRYLRRFVKSILYDDVKIQHSTIDNTKSENISIEFVLRRE